MQDLIKWYNNPFTKRVNVSKGSTFMQNLSLVHPNVRKILKQNCIFDDLTWTFAESFFYQTLRTEKF